MIADGQVFNDLEDEAAQVGEVRLDLVGFIPFLMESNHLVHDFFELLLNLLMAHSFCHGGQLLHDSVVLFLQPQALGLRGTQLAH